jgi:hypothetical protein
MLVQQAHKEIQDQLDRQAHKEILVLQGPRGQKVQLEQQAPLVEGEDYRYP